MLVSLELRFEAPSEVQGKALKVDVSPPGVLVGRHRDCEVCLDDVRVSRRHARLTVADGGLWLEDLGAQNGTVVNGRRVGRHRLVSGDLLGLGRFRLRVVEAGELASHSSVKPPLVKPPIVLPSPPSGKGRSEFYRALGLGDETIVDPRTGTTEQLLSISRRYAALHQLGKVLAEAGTTSDALLGALDLVLEVSEGDHAYVALARGGTVLEAEAEEADTLPPAAKSDGPALGVVAARERGGMRAAVPEMPALSETVARKALSEKQAVLSHDPHDDTRFAASRSLFLRKAEALMAVPIILQERLLGALVVESERAGAFDEETLDLVGAFAPALGQAIENQRLAERREATIAALEEARRRLLDTRQQLVRAEQLAAVGRLASGLAHEVKNHLAPFMLADTIARKYPGDDDLQGAMEMMLEARQHILDLVGEVKAFARGSGDGTGRPEPTDLAELSRSVVRFMDCDAEVARHRLEVLEHGEPLVSVVPGRIRQIVVNLVKNAADAIGVDRAGKITVAVEEADGEARLWVEDDGPGVAPEQAERLFAPFFSTKGDKGLGLGLDIARRIARDHGGNLELVPSPAPGARFLLRLPSL